MLIGVHVVGSERNDRTEAFCFTMLRPRCPSPHFPLRLPTLPTCSGPRTRAGVGGDGSPGGKHAAHISRLQEEK